MGWIGWCTNLFKNSSLRWELKQANSACHIFCIRLSKKCTFVWVLCIKLKRHVLDVLLLCAFVHSEVLLIVSCPQSGAGMPMNASLCRLTEISVKTNYLCEISLPGGTLHELHLVLWLGTKVLVCCLLVPAKLIADCYAWKLTSYQVSTSFGDYDAMAAHRTAERAWYRWLMWHT